MSAVATALLGETEAGAGRIRAFRRDDIPAVTALRRRLFRLSEQRTPERLAAYFEQLFFDGPLGDADLPSLVYEDEAGGVAGFLGVVARRMSWRGRPVRVAVGTQLMVAPERRGLAGKRLARALVAGRQDLTLSDLANDGARRVGESVGFTAVPTWSLQWTLALRPARAAWARGARSLLSRAAAQAMRPLCAVWDAAVVWARGTPAAPAPGDHVERLDVHRDLGELEPLLAQWPLRPVYERTALTWQLSQIARKPSLGALQQLLVRDGGGRALGWCLYGLNPGGASDVIQVAARRGAGRRVLAQLARHAHAHGAVALSGRLDAALAQDLAAAGSAFSADGPWLLVHARDHALTDAIVGGDAFLTRLEGEWWLSF